MNEYEKHCVEVLAENAFWRFASSMPNTMWKYTKKIMMFLTKHNIVDYIGFSPSRIGYNQFRLHAEYFKGLEGTNIEQFMQRLSQFENILLENEDFKKYVKYMKKWEDIPKYILGEKKTIEISGKKTVLYKIIANKDFPSLTIDNIAYLIKKGAEGGYVESEKNLDQKGKCWIYGGVTNYESCVLEDACVTDDSIIQYSSIKGRSIIKGLSFILFSNVNDNTVIENSRISQTFCRDNTYISDSQTDVVDIFDNVEIYNYSIIKNSVLLENIWIENCSITQSTLNGNSKTKKIDMKKNKMI